MIRKIEWENIHFTNWTSSGLFYFKMVYKRFWERQRENILDLRSAVVEMDRVRLNAFEYIERFVVVTILITWTGLLF